jgi:hypothetical protein
VVKLLHAAGRVCVGLCEPASLFCRGRQEETRRPG